jgi:hypothetical protein
LYELTPDRSVKTPCESGRADETQAGELSEEMPRDKTVTQGFRAGSIILLN